ncbi:MAG: hypothetical protein WAT81_04660 [Candidatus Moraniibacteriota bacterium]
MSCFAVLVLLFFDNSPFTSRQTTVDLTAPSQSGDATLPAPESVKKSYSSAFLDPIGERYYQSLFKNSPEAVQGSFVAAIKSGGIDEWAQLDAYFFTHRYVDNGGNIYELYDFIEQRTELSFMKEAENIYPEVFTNIRARRAPFTYSDQGIYAYLAYLEILDRYGYANAAMLSTAANQYAKIAYYKKGIREEKASGKLPTYPDYTKAEIASDIKKGQFFYPKAEEAVRVLMSAPDRTDATVLDTVYAGEQLGSAWRYFSGYGSTVDSEVTAAQAYAFAIRSAYRGVPELYLYVSLSNASTALLVDSVMPIELRTAVYPFLDIRDERIKQSGIVEKIIRARINPTGVRFRDLDIYSRKNIAELGRRVPEFKAWLLSNGWKEQDFDE